VFHATDASGDAILSDTWNYRIETFLVTRELLSSTRARSSHTLSTSVSHCTWKLHSRFFSPREPSFSSQRELSRATVCSNNFRDFLAVARTLWREAINFFYSPILTVTFFFLLPLSLCLPPSFSLSVVRPTAGNLVGRSAVYFLPDFVLQRFLHNSVPRWNRFSRLLHSREVYIHKRRVTQSCRQSRNFLKVPHTKCMTRFLSVSPNLAFS